MKRHLSFVAALSAEREDLKNRDPNDDTINYMAKSPKLYQRGLHPHLTTECPTCKARRAAKA